MEKIIPMNEHGLFAGADFVARVDSRYVAEAFEKQHKDVLRAIGKIAGEESGYSQEFRRRNFEPSEYVDEQRHWRPCCIMTRDGFTALAMGFTGQKADEFKEAYIKRFNEMEQHIQMAQALRDQDPLLTAAIKDTREDSKPYHYSNEADMLNRIVLGMTAKQYREKHGIPKSEQIRPHMTSDEAALMTQLQIMDVGLQYSTPDFQQRKRMLEWYASRDQKALPERHENQP